MSNTNPYQLSTDYAELFKRISEGEVIAAFVDYEFANGGKGRDICEIKIRDGLITGGARGYGVVHLSDFYVSLYNLHNPKNIITLESLFIRNCEQLNLGWIVPIPARAKLIPEMWNPASNPARFKSRREEIFVLSYREPESLPAGLNFSEDIEINLQGQWQITDKYKQDLDAKDAILFRHYKSLTNPEGINNE